MVNLMAKQYYLNCKTLEKQRFNMSTLALNATTCKEHSATTLGPICHYRALNIATMGTLATLKVLKGILLIVFALNIGESQAFQTATVLNNYSVTTDIRQITLKPDTNILSTFPIAISDRTYVRDLLLGKSPYTNTPTARATSYKLNVLKANTQQKSLFSSLILLTIHNSLSLTSNKTATNFLSLALLPSLQIMSDENFDLDLGSLPPGAPNTPAFSSGLGIGTQQPIGPSTSTPGNISNMASLPSTPVHSRNTLTALAAPTPGVNAYNPTISGRDLSQPLAGEETCVINGRIVHVTKSERKDQQAGRLTTKAVRANLTTTQFQDFQKVVAAKQQEPFQLIDISSKDPKKMINNYSISKRLKELGRNYFKYDIDDCFEIIFPVTIDGQASFELTKDDKGDVKSINLLTDYLLVTPLEAALSCQWYNKFAGDTSQLAGDLNLSLCYFEKNVEAALYARVHSQMLDYSLDMHGGPLFLSILLSHLITTDETAKAHIIDTITTYEIKKASIGEKIIDVVDLLKALTNSLYSLKGNTLPDYFIDKIVKIFTTTSVPDFNDMFTLVGKSIIATRLQMNIPGSVRISATGQALVNDKSSVDWVFNYASNVYNSMARDGTWDSHIAVIPGKSLLNATADPTTFPPEVPGIECFNCKNVPGRTKIFHHLRDCPFERDQAVITKNRNAHPNGVRGGSNGGGNGSGGGQQPTRHQANRTSFKWRPPEAGELPLNHRLIDNKPFKYNTSTSRWDLQETPPSGLVTPAPAVVPPPSIQVPDCASSAGSVIPSPLTATGYPLSAAGGYAAIAGGGAAIAGGITGGGMSDADKKEQVRLQLLSFQHYYSSL